MEPGQASNMESGQTSNMEPGQAQENSKAAKNISVPRRVQNAIRKCQGSNGVSFPELKKFLQDSKKIDVGVHGAEIKLVLKNGVDSGILTKESGLYKAKEVAKHSNSRSRPKGGSKGGSNSKKRSGSKKRSSSKKSPRRKSPGRKRSRSGRRRKQATAEE